MKRPMHFNDALFFWQELKDAAVLIREFVQSEALAMAGAGLRTSYPGGGPTRLPGQFEGWQRHTK